MRSAAGGHGPIDKTLSRACRSGTIRKLARGLYDYPRSDPELGLLTPSPDAGARALQDRDATRLQPSGAHAANMLGLSEQVPARAVHLTDGRARRVRIGRREILLKHTTPRQMATAGRISGTVIQALRWIGQRNIDDRTLERLRRRLSEDDRRQLRKDLHLAPAWIADVMRSITDADAA